MRPGMERPVQGRGNTLKNVILVLSLLVASASSAYEVDDLDKYNQYAYYDDPCSDPSNNGKYYKCRDGSVSYLQPDHGNNYEGLCGQTAAANLIHLFCKLEQDVDQIAKKMSDVGPGLMPMTLNNGLNSVFNEYNRIAKQKGRAPYCPTAGSWSRYFYDNDAEFLLSVAQGLVSAKVFQRTRSNGSKVWRSPVAVVVNTGGSVMTAHWATVVDIENFSDPAKCAVFANSYGTQFKISCKEFRKMARFNFGVPGLGSEVRVKYEVN